MRTRVRPTSGCGMSRRKPACAWPTQCAASGSGTITWQRAAPAEALEGSGEPRRARGWVLCTLSQLDLARGDADAARIHADEALATLREEGDLAGVSYALAWSAASVLGGCDPAMAQRRREEAIEIGRASGDNWALAMALNVMGMALIRLDSPDEAVGYLEEALICIHAAGDGFNTANILDSLAWAMLATGDRVGAARCWADALQISISLRHRPGVVWCLYGVSRICCMSHPVRALRLAAGATGTLHGTGAVLAATEVPIVNEVVEAARAALGAEATEAAWQEGVAMSLEELAAYALEEPLLREVAADGRAQSPGAQGGGLVAEGLTNRPIAPRADTQ